MADRNEKAGLNKYRIHIDGHLDAEWADWFDGITITHESDGTSILRGSFSDQPALHSILMKIRDLNLTLLSVNKES